MSGKLLDPKVLGEGLHLVNLKVTSPKILPEVKAFVASTDSHRARDSAARVEHVTRLIFPVLCLVGAP